MSTSLHTFKNIFESEFESEGEYIKINKIIIPIIQRDYAQGRNTPDINRVRKRFLNALYDALLGNPIVLDFVYGDVDVDGTLIPLDGQQRLTTLFLLYWYAAKKDCVSEDEYRFLFNFSYETRYSARDFCDCLVKYTPTYSCDIKDEIINQPWFPLDWEKDPTVSSMLNVINDIDLKFGNVDNLWDILLEDKISFYFLPIKDMGLTDDLYIKMNSRGKPLTLFEHFKAELEHELEKYDLETSKRIIRKMDSEWTDLLWEYRKYDNTLGKLFLRYFHFVCDVICYKNNDTTQGKSIDEFDLIKEYFSGDDKAVSERINILERFFDCWVSLSKEISIGEFFDSICSNEHEVDKVKIDSRYDIDIFGDCLNSYGDSAGKNNNRSFSLNKFILLYAVTEYVINRENINKEDFNRRFRIVNNLVRNSEGEISDSVNRAGGNRMPAILAQVDSIIINGVISKDIKNNFNIYQLEEEINKYKWTTDNPDKEHILFELEDHDLLFGQIGIVGIENSMLFDRFSELFDCDYDCISRALLSIGDYKQRERNGWRYQLGSNEKTKSWSVLFHKSSLYGYENTKNCLIKLLSITDSFDDAFLNSLSNSYIEECEQNNTYDWRYYYIKYDVFRIGGFGKVSWMDFDNNPYELTAMKTESQISSSSYNPFLKEIDYNDCVSRDYNGQRLELEDRFIICRNDAYYAYDNGITDDGMNGLLELVIIPQNDDGIDTEDRIKLYYDSIDTLNPNIKKVVYDGSPGEYDLIKNKIYCVLRDDGDMYCIFDETRDVYRYPKTIFKDI